MLNSAAGRHITRLRIGAAHDDEPLDEAWQFGLAHHGERDIRQRPRRAQDEASGVRACRADDRIRGMQRVRRLLRLWQDRMAEAGLAVNLARVPDRNGNRRRRAWPDRDIRTPRKRQNRACVARCGRKRNVADDRGDAEDLRPVMRAGVEQRQRIVDAGVDVDDQGLGVLGHRGNLPSVSWVRFDPGQMQRDIVAGRASGRQTAKPRRSLPTHRDNRRTATTASPVASPIHRPTPPSGVKKPNARPTGAPIAQ